MTGIRRAAFALAALVSTAPWVLPSPARAAVDCITGLASVQTANDGDLQAYFMGSWHLIAAFDHPALKDRVSFVLAAFLSGREVMLKYPDGYVCDQTEYGTAPVSVRIR